VAFCILSNNNEFEKLNGMSLSYEKSLWKNIFQKSDMFPRIKMIKITLQKDSKQIKKDYYIFFAIQSGWWLIWRG
jgi:hypothetical protein